VKVSNFGLIIVKIKTTFLSNYFLVGKYFAVATRKSFTFRLNIFYPFIETAHADIGARRFRIGTANAPANDAYQSPVVVNTTGQGSSRVTLAGVDPSVNVSGAHICSVRQIVVSKQTVAFCIGH